LKLLEAAAAVLEATPLAVKDLAAVAVAVTVKLAIYLYRAALV
jgi:hypothetical protein